MSPLLWPLSYRRTFGPTYRNRTCIDCLEGNCIIHYTKVRKICRVNLVRLERFEPSCTRRQILSLLCIPFHHSGFALFNTWSGVEESNLYNDFRRIMSYPLNERQCLVGQLGIEPRLDRLWVGCFTIKLLALCYIVAGKLFSVNCAVGQVVVFNFLYWMPQNSGNGIFVSNAFVVVISNGNGSTTNFCQTEHLFNTWFELPF